MNRNAGFVLKELLVTNARDEELFSLFMTQYADKALRYAYVTLHIRQDSEDVAQEAFIRLWRHASRHGVDTLSPALLFHTVTNLCRDRMRYFKRHPEDPTEYLETHAAAVEDSHLALDDEAVLEAVMQLSVPERQCILLFYYMDRSLRDTAKSLGVTEQVVKTRLYRARQHLKPKLEPVWKEGLM